MSSGEPLWIVVRLVAAENHPGELEGDVSLPTQTLCSATSIIEELMFSGIQASGKDDG